jgi:MFS family permease
VHSSTSQSNRWLILAIACLAQFMVVLDNTIVNVALASVQRGLHFSPDNLQWVINAYTLVFGGFLMLGGRAADLLGRRRLFVAGVVLFSAASLLNGLAQSSTMLILGRGLQGLGGALVSPAALSIIMTTFTDTGERTRALGVWSAIAAGVALLAVFVAIEARSNAPLVKLSIFRVRSLTTGNIAMLLAASAMFGMFFFISLYVQEVLGYSPLKAGFAFLPASLGIIVGAGLAQSLIPRLGVRGVGVTGLGLATIGMLLLANVPVHGSYVSDILVGLVPLSIGMGLTFVPVTLLGTSGVEGSDAGMASGLFNSAQQVGGSLGLAILSTLAADHASSLIKAGHISAVAARVSGYHVAFLAAAAMLAAGTVLLVVLLRRRHLTHVSTDPSQAIAAAA